MLSTVCRCWEKCWLLSPFQGPSRRAHKAWDSNVSVCAIPRHPQHDPVSAVGVIFPPHDLQRRDAGGNLPPETKARRAGGAQKFAAVW